MDNSGTIMIGYDFSKNDECILVIGKVGNGIDVEIINTFKNEEAIDIYNKLTGGVE